MQLRTILLSAITVLFLVGTARLGVLSASISLGSWEAESVVGSGNITKIDKPTKTLPNGSTSSTNMDTLKIYNAEGEILEEGKDYYVSGLGTKHLEIQWKHKPPEGSKISFSGRTPARGIFTATATWPGN